MREGVRQGDVARREEIVLMAFDEIFVTFSKYDAPSIGCNLIEAN
jgi:hypothetical protein